jgi:multiple sugar transport system permease protein
MLSNVKLSTADRGVLSKRFLKAKRDTTLRTKQLVSEIWRSRLSYLFMAPFFLAFVLFIVVPIAAGIILSFTYYNAVQFPTWVGWNNYQDLLSQDTILLQHVIPNSFKFSLFVGPLGFVFAFILAWAIAQLPKVTRMWYALAIYTPSLAVGVAIAIVWQVAFTGDRSGYINSFLLEWGFIEKPILFLMDKDWLLDVMVIASIWGSMGIGFLALLAGILNVDAQLYEAGKIDGISSRLQEIWYITLPSMKPQLMFAGVMSIVYTLKSGGIGTLLVGNPTPNYAGQLFISHIEDYGFIRFELGYASAITVVLLAVTLLLNQLLRYMFAPKEGE